MKNHEPENSLEMRHYRMGREAHAQGKTADSFAGTCLVRRGWYAAGWHDADIEAGNTVLEQLAKRRGEGKQCTN